jgi:hypothetical protein
MKLDESYKLDSKELEIKPLSVTLEKMLYALNVLGADLRISYAEQLELLRQFFIEKQRTDWLIEQVHKYKFSSEKDPSIRRKKLNTSLKILAAASPMDLVCALYLYKTFSLSKAKEYYHKNDIELENGMVYDLFSDMAFSSESEILIIYPTPFFVRKWVADRRFSSRKVVMVMHSSAEKELIIFNYEEGSYSTKRIDNIRFLDDETGYELSDLFTEKSLVLFFARYDILMRQNKKWMDYFPENRDYEGLIMLANYESAHALLPLPGSADEEKIKMDDIILIPQGIWNSASPRRKMLMTLHSGTDNSADADELIDIYSYTLKTEKNVQQLEHMNEVPVTIAQKEMSMLDVSIRKIYNDALLNLKRQAPVRTRKKSSTYEFTPDILIHYSVSGGSGESMPRIEAYVYQSDDDSDRMIKESRKHTTKIPPDEITEWLENCYPFSIVAPRKSEQKSYTDIRSIIIENYMNTLSAPHNITVKTFWYIYPNLQDVCLPEDYALLNEMMKTDIGCVRMADISTEVFENLLENVYPEDSKELLLRKIRILADVVDEAVRTGYLSGNPLRESLEDLKKMDRLFYQVRDALVKKHLTMNENWQCYSQIISKIEEGQYEYFGVLLKLLTGLGSNVLCALRWRDVRYIKDYAIQQIFVTKQLTNDGKTVKGFTGMDEYMCFPCTDEVSRALQFLNKQLIGSVSDRTSLSDKPIIGTMEILLGKDEKHPFYPPKNLEAISKEILMRIGVPEHIIAVPDNDNGTKETNLNHYSGDLFRENFRYWSLSYSKLSEDEVSYLLGNKRKTTFGRYYCDYLNDASQFVLRTKLQRLSAMITVQPANNQNAREINKMGTAPMHLKFSSINHNYPLHVTAQLDIQGIEGNSTVDVACTYGCTAELIKTDTDQGVENK